MKVDTYIDDKFSYEINPAKKAMTEFVSSVVIVYRGKSLTRLGIGYGIKRKWFGLESDKSYRKRLLNKIHGR